MKDETNLFEINKFQFSFSRINIAKMYRTEIFKASQQSAALLGLVLLLSVICSKSRENGISINIAYFELLLRLLLWLLLWLFLWLFLRLFQGRDVQ